MSGPTLPARAVASSTDILTEFFGFHGDLPPQEYFRGSPICLFVEAVGSRGSSGDQFWGACFIFMSDGDAFYANTAWTLTTTSTWQVTGSQFLCLARLAELARRSTVEQQQVCRRFRERPNTSSIIPNHPPHAARVAVSATALTDSRPSSAPCAQSGRSSAMAVAAAVRRGAAEVAREAWQPRRARCRGHCRAMPRSPGRSARAPCTFCVL